MKMKNMFAIGILLAVLLSIDAMSIAMAQNTSNENPKDKETHECTPEMMENMSKNCPEQMMASGTNENMMNQTNRSSMMDKKAENNETAGADHCGDSDSGMSLMMASKDTATKPMM